MKKYSLILIAFFLITVGGYAQQKPRFWDDVQTIKNYDKMFQVPEHLFYSWEVRQLENGMTFNNNLDI